MVCPQCSKRPLTFSEFMLQGGRLTCQGCGAKLKLDKQAFLWKSIWIPALVLCGYIALTWHDPPGRAVIRPSVLLIIVATFYCMRAWSWRVACYRLETPPSSE